MKRVLKTLLTLSLIICMSGCFFVKKDVYILYTADVHGNVDGAINYASLKAYKDNLKKQFGYVSLVDGGDFSEGSDFITNSKGKAAIEIMNLIGYDAATLGNHEFDFGLDILKDNINSMEFPIVCTNIEYIGNKENPLKKVKPYIIKSYGGVKIAYIGVSTSYTVYEASDAYSAVLEDGQPALNFYDIPGDSEDISVWINKIQDTINDVRSKVDYVIIISHLGDKAEKSANVYNMINNTTGVDIVLDAHSHSTIEGAYEKNLEGNDVLLFAIGEQFSKIGQLIIRTDGTFETKFITEIAEKDSTVQAKIDELR